MAKIQDLPPLDRPREKAIHYGINTLSDAELIALLVGSGYQGGNANEIASSLLNSTCGLYGLSYLSLCDLEKCKGIKEGKALVLASVFEIHRRLSKKEHESLENGVDSKELFLKYKSELNSLYQEVLILVIVDKQNRPIFETTLYKGNDAEVMFSYKDIWRELLTHKGSGFYLIHNHPNGVAEPSNKDLVFTSEVLRESKKIKIPLIDHLIIGGNSYCSIMTLLKAV